MTKGDIVSILRRLLLTSAALVGTAVIAHPASAQSLSPSASGPAAGTDRQAASASFHAFSQPGFSGPDRYFSGNVGQCKYVGSAWNDRIRSARTESSARVELWDNANCTGGAIVIDSSGYRSIGAWVSAYRVTST